MMDFMTHEEYRNTEYWYNLRHRLFDLRGGRCEKCGAYLHDEAFDIHHKDGIYQMFHEDDRNLVLLCRQCHGTYHKPDYRIPNGIHDFTVKDVDYMSDKNGKWGYKIKLAVVRKYDGKECWCNHWISEDGDPVRDWMFRKCVGLDDDVELMDAINMTGRALFKYDDESGYNSVERFFTYVNVI